MKKIFITCLLLMFTLVNYGQLLDNFESGEFSGLWTFYTAANSGTNSWKIVKSEVPPVTMKDIPAVCGKYIATSKCGGGVEVTDSWMITPQVTVREKDFLKFVLANPFAYAMTHDTLDILISETTVDKTAFNVNIMRIIPRTPIPWKEISIDLSRFSGKNIYIAFRDYHRGCGSFVTEYIFIDNISLSQTPSYDLSMDQILGLKNGCATEQTIKAVVKNNGVKTDRFTLAYQLNKEKMVLEEINITLDTGESDTVTFSVPTVFKEGLEHNVKVWVKNSQTDLFVNNDTLNTSVKIGKELTFPYKMTDKGENDFTVIGASSDVWKFGALKGTDKYGWILSGKSVNLSSSLISNCIPLSGGKFMLSFKYSSSHDISLTILTGAPFANSSQSYNTIQLPKSAELKDTQIMLILPETITSVGFSVKFPGAMWSEYCEFTVSDINIDIAKVDLSTISIRKPILTSMVASDEDRDLTVSFKNVGAGEVRETDLCFQIDNEDVVREKLSAVVPEGDLVEHTFERKIILSQPGNHLLKVWCDAYGDVQASNDTIKQNILVYQPKVFPFTETFAETSENSKWSVINEDDDAVFWSFLNHPGAIKGGILAYKNSISGITSNDYLISPAINMPVGKARISFYYATSSYNTGTGKLKVLMGTGPDPEKMTTVLFDHGLTNKGWLNGYALLDIKEAGNYYFAFYGYGISGDIFLDYIKVDAGEDLCMNSIAFAETTGFNKTKSDVKVSFINHGVSAQNNIPVSYFIEGKLVSTETIAGPVLPGDTTMYIFKKQADISIPDSTYRLMARIDKTVGEDVFNDQMIAWAVEHWANKRIPYYQNFENVADVAKWYVPAASKGWIFQNNMFYSYSGTNYLIHSNGKEVADNWIFSECIEIPAGTYELSFFYRTMKNMDTAPYKQKFKVMLGTGTSAQEMFLPVAEYDSITVATPGYKKHSSRVTISQGGKYYIGFYNYSKPGNGNTCIEDVEIKPVDTGIALSYTADFESNQFEWTKYNPSRNFYQWDYTVSGFDTYMYVNRDDTYYSTEGLFVSPALAIDKGKDVIVNIDYSVVSEVDSVRLNLYAGNINNPDSMQVVTQLVQSKDFVHTTYEFKSSVDMPYYFGFGSNSLAKYELKLAAFKVEYKGGEGSINGTVPNAVTVYVSQKKLHILSKEIMQKATLTDVLGKCVYNNAQVNSDQLVIPEVPSGVYILKLECGDRSMVRKVRID